MTAPEPHIHLSREHISIAGKDRPTGIPEVDEVIDREGHYIPAVG